MSKPTERSNQEEFYRLGCVLLGMFIAALTSETAKTIARRLAHLAKSRWLAGHTDHEGLAAVMNLASRSVDDLTKRQRAPKMRVGRSVYIRPSDLLSSK